MPFREGPFEFTPAGIRNMNEVAGVYGITNEMLKMIYIGQTDNLRRRLSEHYNDPKDRIWRYGPRKHYAEAVPGGETARKKREADLIKEWNYPPCNN